MRTQKQRIKACFKCRNLLSLNNFQVDNSKKDKLNIYCKSCRGTERSLRYKQNREKELNRQRAYNLLNKEKIIKSNRKYYAKNKESISIKNKERNRKNYFKGKYKLSEKQFRRNYNISKSDYLEMLLIQNNVCAICLLQEETRNLSVDHNHTTGKVRGLLCKKCNLGLGLFKDNVKLLKKSIKYLKRYE